MAPKNTQSDDGNGLYLQLIDSLKDVAVMISKTDMRLENIKSQQDESIKKIDKIEHFINNFYDIENKIKIIEQKDLVIINREIEDLKNDLHELKGYIDEICKKVENQKSKIWEVKGDTKEMKVFNDNLKTNIKFWSEIFLKTSVGILATYALYKLGINK